MKYAKLSPLALGLASGLVWGLAIFLCAFFNKTTGSYAGAFIDVIASVYPGYDGLPNTGSVLVGTGYAVVDGGIGGAVFAWLYNAFLGLKGQNS